MKFKGCLFIAALWLCGLHSFAQDSTPLPQTLSVHRVFSSHMVIQRDKPIKVWGWAKPGNEVAVQLGDQELASAIDKDGRWEVVFDARKASAEGIVLSIITSGGESLTFEDILIGDVWLMNGQSNMAWTLGHSLQSDLAIARAHFPLLRRFGVNPNESSQPQTQLPEDKVIPWTTCAPDSVADFSAIGYHFGTTLQQALQIPIGIIDTARGGASLESMVPGRKFKDSALTAAYLAHLEKRIKTFDAERAAEKLWERRVDRLTKNSVPAEQWPKDRGVSSLRSWDIPGESPADAASCYNGMVGVFRGLNIKGVLFHHGLSNVIKNCRPRRYRTMMRMVIEGWREDFNDPRLPIAVIGFSATGIPQKQDNFELWSFARAGYIREAQQLAVIDMNDAEHTAYLPAHDIQTPGVHPEKKLAHGIRAARWALNRIYKTPVQWESAKLLSSQNINDYMMLKFDKPVFPHDMSTHINGFSIADKSGKYYKAYATWPITNDVGIWNTANKNYDGYTVYVWSPLVKKPVSVRYAWAPSPLANLYVEGKSWQPLHSFRTDKRDLPESNDPAVEEPYDPAFQEAHDIKQRNSYRKAAEARMGAEIQQRLRALNRISP